MARKKAENEHKIALQLAAWKPDFTSDSYSSLFVANLAYNISENTLKREFERFGPLKSIVIVQNQKTAKSQGYAFLEFENERDMKDAYKEADGLKIEGRRVLVDVERGRTVREWKPRRFGGGLGSKRDGKQSKIIRPDDSDRRYKPLGAQAGRRDERRPSNREDRSGQSGGTSRPRDRSEVEGGRVEREGGRDRNERDGGRGRSEKEGGWGRSERDSGRDRNERAGGRGDRDGRRTGSSFSYSRAGIGS